MDKNNDKREDSKVPESPKPLAFTIDFGDGKAVPTQRYKDMVEKYQKKHKRGQSLSKIDDIPTPPKKHPLSGNLPRKFSFQSEGYFSSDEKADRGKNVRGGGLKRTDLTLPLRAATAKANQLPSKTFIVHTPDVELKDVSSPELDLISPFSPKAKPPNKLPGNGVTKHYSSPECESKHDDQFIDGNDFDFDRKSDTVSDAGTYTLDADNYSEEQKARMSIDQFFKLEEVSVLKKTEDYIKSLASFRDGYVEVAKSVQKLNLDTAQSPKSPKLVNKFVFNKNNNKLLSPIMSPTQNLSITQSNADKEMNNGSDDSLNTTFTKIMFPSPKCRHSNGLEPATDEGNVISITSSGAFRKNEKEKTLARKLSLTKSEIHVEAYIGNKVESETIKQKLTANIVNVQSICKTDEVFDNFLLDKVNNLPPIVGGVGGKVSPTKIPSPVYLSSRPRSRSSVSSVNVDLSDSSLETESYLKPTQNFINSLQQRLSLDSDQESDCGIQLNNTAHNLLKQRATHVRHNSLDDKISNKLEHFHSKNLQGIDQTYIFNQYNQNRVIHKIQNSPNNSPIRRSSSFSNKNQIPQKNVNMMQKESNLRISPNLSRSSSTANIKPFLQLRHSSIGHKIDRGQFGDTESSSEEDFDKNQKKKNLADLTSTRYNRAFSLRRARLDEPPKCPNTPEMRRKFQDNNVRAISVDRKPIKTNDVQSRYLLNATKKPNPPKPVKAVPKAPEIKNKMQVFSRTDTGRFSMKTNKPLGGAQFKPKRDTDKKSGGRSNSSLSCREVEFQNWKRRKSYDPMKAAAEGKRKEMVKRQNVMTQSYTEANQNLDCDSSPSHSNSVHRSQSFHGTAALGQLLSSEEEGDLTLSADEGFSPPTPSPCELSPTRASFRNSWKEHVLH